MLWVSQMLMVFNFNHSFWSRRKYWPSCASPNGKKGDTACLVSYSYTSRELFSVLEDDKLTCTGGNSYSFRNVSEISYWFLQEEGLLVGDKLTWTENLARDPWLIYLGGGFTWDRFEKQNVLNKLNFLYMVYVYLRNLYYLVNIIWTWRTSNCKKPQG